MSDEDIARFAGDDIPLKYHDLSPGDLVRVKEGPFAEMESQVERSDPATQRITMFGRPTPVEMTPDQVEKIPWEL